MLRLIFVLLFFPFTLSAQLKRFQFSQIKMGSPFNIIIYHHDSAQALEAANECYALIDSLNNIFSDYSSTSEIRLLSQQLINKEIPVSDELFSVLTKSKEAWRKSGKTFDITMGALSSVWRNANSEERFPSKKEIRKAKRSIGYQNLELNAERKTVFFKRKGMLLDFGGIVKGYAAQQVINHLKSRNILIALADAGGDIVMGDPPPGKNGWTVGINLPEQENEIWNDKLELKNCAVATSGDVYRFTLNKGKKYSHIIDPRSGYGVTSLRNVTVIAKDGTNADWLATACSILPIEKALALARKENASLLIAVLKDGKIIIHATENFNDYFQSIKP